MWFLIKNAAFKWKDTISGLPVSPGSAEALLKVRWENKVHVDCLLSQQHLCQKLLQSNRVCKDYSKSKVGRFLRHSVDFIRSMVNCNTKGMMVVLRVTINSIQPSRDKCTEEAVRKLIDWALFNIAGRFGFEFSQEISCTGYLKQTHSNASHSGFPRLPFEVC